MMEGFFHGLALLLCYLRGPDVDSVVLLRMMGRL